MSISSTRAAHRRKPYSGCGHGTRLGVPLTPSLTR
jgi:hypothetical protein